MNSNKFKRYESTSEQVLPEGFPVVARIDGNSFSKLTEDNFKKPFDKRFERLMNASARAVMEYCTHSVLAYIQSDEISILLDPNKEGSFLGGRTQKLSSLLAGYASAAFSSEFGKPAAFDCRVFVIPENEILNYFNWRQKNAWRNCLHSTAFYEIAKDTNKEFAHERLQGAGESELQEILFHDFGINANDIPTHRKRGRCLRRVEKEYDIEEWMDEPKFETLKKKGYVEEGQTVKRGEIELDTEIPIFRKDRRYIDYTYEEPFVGVA
jgi:tRNA(His) 5'-end guanylyltransferase